MARFFGAMEAYEVEIEKRFKDRSGFEVVTIQASDKGWTIIYSDYSTTYEETVDTAENNFKAAFEYAAQCFGELTEAK